MRSTSSSRSSTSSTTGGPSIRCFQRSKDRLEKLGRYLYGVWTPCDDVFLTVFQRNLESGNDVSRISPRRPPACAHEHCQRRSRRRQLIGIGITLVQSPVTHGRKIHVS